MTTISPSSVRSLGNAKPPEGVCVVQFESMLLLLSRLEFVCSPWSEVFWGTGEEGMAGWEGYGQPPIERSSEGADGVLGVGAGLDTDSAGNDGSDAGVMLVRIARGKIEQLSCDLDVGKGFRWLAF
jgi:hypothetical protein